MVESKLVKPEVKKEIKTFKNLEDEIVKTNMCCACGSCVAYCESQAFDVIEMSGYTPKFKSDKSAENCTECGLCYYICPQTTPLLDKINAEYKIEDELGPIKDVIAAKTTNEQIKELGQDGGVVSIILTYLFDKHMIDGAIVSEFDEDLKPIPTVIFDKEEIVKSSGTRYSISSQLLPLKELYNIPLEIQKKNTIYDINQLRFAFVGTPCQIRAVRKMHLLNITPAHVIKYVIGLFCFENFDYEVLYRILKEETNMKASNIKKTAIKKNFFVTAKNNKQYEVNIKKLDSAVRAHCRECDEFTGKFSDISVGASGAPPNYSMIIIRSEKGQRLIDSLLSEGYLEQYVPPSDQSSDWKLKKLEWFKKMVFLKTKS